MALRIASLILAAGESRRLGRCKQLLMLGNQTLLNRCCLKSLAVFPEDTYVVLGSDAATIQASLVVGAHPIVIDQWRSSGIGGSIAAGVSYLTTDSKCYHAVLVILADQVLVTENDLQKLTMTYRERPPAIVCSSYHNTVGVPAIFPDLLFPALSSLSGDSGAKNVILDNRELCCKVPIPNAEFDIDTEGDLEQFNAIFYQKP